MKRLRRGQSTIEYLILLTAVIGAILVAFGTGSNGIFRGKIQNMVNGSGTAIDNAMNAFNNTTNYTTK